MCVCVCVDGSTLRKLSKIGKVDNFVQVIIIHQSPSSSASRKSGIIPIFIPYFGM